MSGKSEIDWGLNGTPSNFRQITHSFTILLVALRPRNTQLFSRRVVSVSLTPLCLTFAWTSFIKRLTKSFLDGNNIGFLLVVGRSALLSLPSHLKTPLPSLYNPNCLTLGNDNETIPLKKRLHERSKCSWRKEHALIELESSVNPQKIKAR